MPETELLDDEACRRAVAARDAEADGRFLYAVLSTGIYCHPSCKARAARPENLRFYPTRDVAERAGYRPCRRCRPDLPPRAQRDAALVAEACREIEAGCYDAARFAADRGTSAAQVTRTFRLVAGVTPSAYAASRRQRVAQASLRSGPSVTDAIYAAGFGSSGRFYEAADGMLGMTPGAWRAGGAGEVLHHATGGSWLGRVLVASTDRGVCAILIGSDDATLLADLGRRFPRATLRPAEAAFAAHLDSVLHLIEEPVGAHALPLDIRGTAFQRRVWQALRDIPPGRTQTYGEVARRLGMAEGARAVAAACGANKLAVAVPCHRVVAASGEPAGYRWGVERKRALLERES